MLSSWLDPALVCQPPGDAWRPPRITEDLEMTIKLSSPAEDGCLGGWSTPAKVPPLPKSQPGISYPTPTQHQLNSWTPTARPTGDDRSGRHLFVSPRKHTSHPRPLLSKKCIVQEVGLGIHTLKRKAMLRTQNKTNNVKHQVFNSYISALHYYH